MKIITEYQHRIQWKSTSVIVTFGLLITSFVGITTAIAVARNTNDALDARMDMSASADIGLDSLTAVVGLESATTTGSAGPSNSWPAELISSSISQIQPQREGVIVEWRVGVGQRVSAGQILGKISSPPTTPELTKMLAEQTEAVTRARAEASATDSYTDKERARLAALKDSISGSSKENQDLTFTALQKLRDVTEAKKAATRAFVERAFAQQVLTISNFTDWRLLRFNGFNRQYGGLNQNLQNEYEMAMLRLADSLKKSDDLPIDLATQYLALAVRLANATVDAPMLSEFKSMTNSDQKEFLDMLTEYKDSQIAVADKETEYKNMIAEKSSMLERDRVVAQAGATAAEASYQTVANEITGGRYIYAPRTGSVSAIYKKPGDLVDPTMSIAVIAGNEGGELTVRMHIPSNVRSPKIGDIVSVVRPGFSKDVRQARIVGVGTTLDEVGSYMADAVLLGQVDWPAAASVRVIVSNDQSVPVVPMSSIWWDENGAPHIWGVTEIGRLYAKSVKIGRTFGSSAEIYEGLKKGDRYIVKVSPDMNEDMLLSELQKEEDQGAASTKPGSGGHDQMPGMQM